MTNRSGFVAPIAGAAVVSAWLVAACGSYDNGPSGSAGKGGTAPTAGTGGSTGGAGMVTGGSAGMATGGSAGMVTGGSAGMATGGSAGATGGTSGTGGSGASGAPMGGASGSGTAGMGAAGATGGAGAPQVDCMAAAAAPCGGDVVGTWTAGGCDMTVSGMADLSKAGIGCTSAPVEGSVKVTGTLTASADGTFMDDTTFAGQVTMELAKECLMISGFMGTCDRLGFSSAGFRDVMCVDNAGTEGCTCTVTIDQTGGLGVISFETSVGDFASGTYTAADNKLTLTAADQNIEYAYCVAGNTLTVEPGTPTNLGMVTGPMVFQK